MIDCIQTASESHRAGFIADSYVKTLNALFHVIKSDVFHKTTICRGYRFYRTATRTDGGARQNRVGADVCSDIDKEIRVP